MTNNTCLLILLFTLPFLGVLTSLISNSVFVQRLALCIQFLTISTTSLILYKILFLNEIFEAEMLFSIPIFSSLIKLNVLTASLCIITSILAFFGLTYSASEDQKLANLALFVTQFALFGVFSAENLYLFYIFFELMILPTIVSLVSSKDFETQKSGWRMLYYTLAGSFSLLLGIIIISSFSGELNPILSSEIGKTFSDMPSTTRYIISLLFLFAFLVKIPAIPFHSWQAPAYRSMPGYLLPLVVGVMGKAGIIGIIKFLPLNTSLISSLLFCAGFVGVLWGCFAAISSKSARELLAFSSLSHLGFIVLTFALPYDSLFFSTCIQILGHTILSGATFMTLVLIENGNMDISLLKMHGRASKNRFLAFIFIVFCLLSAPLPLSPGFILEMSVIVSVIGKSLILALILIFSTILSGCYTVKIISSVCYGEDEVNTENDKVFCRMAYLPVFALLIISFVLGIYPNALPSEFIESARVTRLTENNSQDKFKFPQPTPDTTDSLFHNV